MSIQSRFERFHMKYQAYEFPNDFRSHYVRLMMEQEKDLVGKFGSACVEVHLVTVLSAGELL
jgi:hypothetical protein